MRADNISFIVARRDRGISKPSDLRGRHIGTQPGSAIHFFLYQFLLELGIGDKDVNVTFDKIEALAGLLESGQVDAVSIRDPYFSQCLDKLGDGAIVFNDPGIYEQTETLVTTEKLLKEKPGIARAVLAALIEAEAYSQPTAENAAIIARYMDMRADDVLKVLHNYHIRVELRHSLLLLLEEVARWGISSGLVDGEVPNYADILAPEPLLELAPDRVTLIR
jgi:NitT/TauT family transport system substrate-binding protein